MLTNKWIQFALSAAIALSGSAAAFDWSAVVSSKTAGSIAAGIGLVKMVLNAIAPAAGTVAAPTNGTFVTHTAA